MPRIANHSYTETQSRNSSILGFLCVSVSLWFVLHAPGSDRNHIRVATFDVDASPPVGSPLAYDPCKEVETPLSCRGIVILGADKPVVLCAVDWIGIGNSANEYFREQLATAASTTANHVSVHTLHQHDAPWCDFGMDEILSANGLPGKQFDSGFARDVMQRAADAIKTSIGSAEPVTQVGLGRG